jgi:hypothetical protein
MAIEAKGDLTDKMEEHIWEREGEDEDGRKVQSDAAIERND